MRSHPPHLPSALNIEVVASIDHAAIRKELIDYLAPHELDALFLLGNLLNYTGGQSVMYTARNNGKLVGLCGYYPAFESCSIFSEDLQATREFARIVLRNHPSIKTILGKFDIVEPAYELCVAAGKRSIRDPEMVFLELETPTFVPYTSPEVMLRLMTKRDIDRVAQLQRILHHIPIEGPLTNEERVCAQVSPMTACCEADGKIVAIASTNGKAITAFQILGVVTDPAYRRKGYAKAACSYLICALRQEGATKAVLFTDKDNVGALECYRSLGFHETGRYCAPWFG